MRHAHLRGRGLAALMTVTLLTAQLPAWAQTDDDRAGARAAATAGAAAMQAGKWEEAVDLFTRAESLVHAPPHLLYIARALVKQGKLVRARETYLKITREELASNAPRAFVDAQAAANAEIAAIEPRLPVVKIVVEGEKTEGAVVTLDGATVPAALVGLPHPIDPGEHMFQAKTKTWASAVVPMTFTEGMKDPLTVTLKLTEKLPEEPVIATAPAAAGPEGTPQKESLSTLRLGSYIGLGVGVIGLAVGTIFLAQNRGKRGDADALCPGGKCPESTKAQVTGFDSDANSAATKAWIGYAIGVVGIGAGATLFILSLRAKKAEPTTGLSVQPWIGVGSAGMSGRF